jgi:hypothetical protein
MSSFDDQVYNLKEALWHERGKKIGSNWPYPRVQDIIEAERRKKIADLQARLAPEPELPPVGPLTILPGAFVIVLCLWLWL